MLFVLSDIRYHCKESLRVSGAAVALPTKSEHTSQDAWSVRPFVFTSGQKINRIEPLPSVTRLCTSQANVGFRFI
jgi:hypothetical protein